MSARCIACCIVALMLSDVAAAPLSCLTDLETGPLPLDSICPACANNPMLKTIKVDNIEFTPTVTQEFQDGVKENIIYLEQKTTLDLSALPKAAFDFAKPDVDAMNSCSKEFDLGQFGMHVADLELANLNANLQFTANTCFHIYYIKCRHLKCRKQKELKKLRWFEHTFGLEVVAKRVIYGEDNASMKVVASKPSIDDRGFKEKAKIASTIIASGLGGSIGGVVGSLVAWEAIDDALGRVGDELPSLDTIGFDDPEQSGLSNKPRLISQFDRMPYLSSRTGFFNQDGKIKLITVRQQKEYEEIFCKRVRPKLEEKVAFLRSIGNPTLEWRVSNGDSLWSIARSVYGNGRYHIAIYEDNVDRLSPSKILTVGTTLKLTPMVNLVKDPQMLERGDSLWRFSKRSLNSGTRYPEVYAINARTIQHPDLVYPLQRVQIPANAR